MDNHSFCSLKQCWLAVGVEGDGLDGSGDGVDGVNQEIAASVILTEEHEMVLIARHVSASNHLASMTEDGSSERAHVGSVNRVRDGNCVSTSRALEHVCAC